MKQALTLCLALAFTSVSFASNTQQQVEETFQRYWAAFTKKDFAKATTEILPSDLDDLKAAILPVFVGAQGHKVKEVQELVNAFFGRIVGKARETMAPQEVFTGLNRVLMVGNPQLFDMLREASTTIIFVRTPDADNAEVHFQLTLQGESEIEVETLTKKNGRWWMRVKEDPRETAEGFKQMFAQAS
jgi:hypothetical protein